jgi:hypothetical protein
MVVRRDDVAFDPERTLKRKCLRPARDKVAWFTIRSDAVTHS